MPIAFQSQNKISALQSLSNATLQNTLSNQVAPQADGAFTPLTKESLSRLNLVATQVDFTTIVEAIQARPSQRGKPRTQLQVPIALASPLSDSSYFEDPGNPAQLYYLPAYRLATERVSGAVHYRAQMAEVNGQWHFSVTLEPYTHPALGAVGAEVQILPHEIDIHLRWQIPNTGGATRKQFFMEKVRNADQTLTFVAHLASLAERDALYTALTEQDALATLVLERLVHVALPVTAGGVTNRGDLLTAKLNPNLSNVLSTHLPAQKVILADQVKIDQSLLINPNLRPDRFHRNDFMILPDLFVNVKPALPTPLLALTGQEFFENEGETMVRYRLQVDNWQAYDDSLFAAAPDLPPCGRNFNASRTWVDIFDQNNQRIYGFCAFSQASNLQGLWVVSKLSEPLTGIYIQLVDRRATLSARSNTIVPPAIVLYEEVTRIVPTEEALFFNPDLHGYIFQNFTKNTGGGQGLIPRLVNFKGSWHTYYQDELQRNRFAYLPDAFKLTRRQDGTHPPLLRLELPGDEPDHFRLTYVATPYLDWDRLEAAEGELKQYVPATVTEPLLLEPFQTSAVRFVPFNTALYTGGSTTTINLTVLQSTVTLTRDQFTGVWDELNGAATLSLSGKIAVDVQGFPPAEIPVTLRLDDTVGELLAVTTNGVPDQNGYRLTLRNAIESPLQLRELGAFVQSVSSGLADVRVAAWRDLRLPSTPLPPGGELHALLMPPAGAAVHAFLPLVDTDQIEVLPATEALFDAMLTGSVREYQRPVTIQVPAGLFTQPSGKIAAIQVTFVGGETVILAPSADSSQSVVSVTAQVTYPLRNVLLGKPVGNWYHYSVVVAWENGNVSLPSAPIDGEANTFFLRVPQLG